MIKICFLAPSGYGKSTAVSILEKKYKVINVKIAEPMYELQKMFYEKIKCPIGNTQDGELLQFLGMKIRKENPDFLLNEFSEKVYEINNVDIIIKDDCRPIDYNYLKELGFIFIKIEGYTHKRNDHSPIDKKNILEWDSDIPFNYVIQNISSLDKYEEELLNTIELIKNNIEKCYIFPTVNVCNCDCDFCISKTRDFSKFPNFLKVDNNFIDKIRLIKKVGIKKIEITGGG